MQLADAGENISRQRSALNLLNGSITNTYNFFAQINTNSETSPSSPYQQPISRIQIVSQPS